MTWAWCPGRLGVCAALGDSVRDWHQTSRAQGHVSRGVGGGVAGMGGLGGGGHQCAFWAMCDRNAVGDRDHGLH